MSSNNDICPHTRFEKYLKNLTPLDKIRHDALEGLEDWVRGPARHQPRRGQVNANAVVDLNDAFLSAQPRQHEQHLPGLDTTCNFNGTITDLNALDNAFLEIEPMEVDEVEVEPAAASRTSVWRQLLRPIFGLLFPPIEPVPMEID